MTALHEDLVTSLETAGLTLDPETRPEYWRPHVNLADRDVKATVAGEIMSYLLEEAPKHWTLELTEVSRLGRQGCRHPRTRLQLTEVR